MTTDIKDIQSAGEGIVTDNKIEFMGEVFSVPDKISFMPMLLFAKAAKSGVDSADMDGLAAMYDMIHGCLEAEDGERFDQVALDNRASDQDLLDTVSQVMEIVSARPTEPPSGYSSPARNSSKKSKGRSSSRVPPGAENLTTVENLVR